MPSASRIPDDTIAVCSEIDAALLKAVKPDGSGKFSPKLHRFLRKNPRYHHVYYAGRLLPGYPDLESEFDPDARLILRRVYFGFRDDEGWIHGADAASILCDNGQTFAHPPGHLGTTQDITDWFWAEYPVRGRCAFDPQHTQFWMNDNDRYTVINKQSRRCNWCGTHQRKAVKSVHTVERKELWSS